jgi:hypothetical protein
MSGQYYLLWVMGGTLVLGALLWPLSTGRPSRSKETRWQAWPPLL